MSLEGELHLRLHLQEGHITGLQLRSTRPDVAQRLLQGRLRSEVEAAVPLLFSVCAHSQSVACRMALAVAAGTAPTAAEQASARATLAEEMLRETAWQLLLHQPRWLDEMPSPAELAAARAAARWRWPTSASDTAMAAATADAAETIAQAVFGCSAAAWLQLDGWPGLTRWAATGGSAAARYLHTLLGDAAGSTGACVALLGAPEGSLLAALAKDASAPGYASQPTSGGAPAETGALARLQHDPWLLACRAALPSRAAARHTARLRELALLLTGQAQPGLGWCQTAPGWGVAGVDNARGVLLHQVQLEGDRVSLYRIVAPTEWNFHPAGALAAELHGAPAADAAAARQRAQRVVRSLDPCVACTVEVEGA